MSDNPFEALLDEVDQLAKALPAAEDEADAKIAAAAADGEEEGEEEGEAAGDDEGLTKSFKVVLEDGTETDAIDAGDLIKSMVERLDVAEGNDGLMLKAMQGLVAQSAALGDLVKSLQGQVAKLSSEGRGRKAVVSISERPAASSDLAKSQAEAGHTMNAQEFLAKALSLCESGALSAHDIAVSEICINQGNPPPPNVVAAVAAASK